MRIFPKPPQDQLISFIFHSVRLDHLAIKFEDIEKSKVMKETDPKINPYALGHFKAINYVLKTAAEEDILKNPATWLKDINLKLSLPLAKFDEISGSPEPLSLATCGTWRTKEKRLGDHMCPVSAKIPNLIVTWGRKLNELDKKFAPKMTNSRLLTGNDIQEINSQIYQSSLELIAIQPFWEATNRTARLAENLLRLHFQMPWLTRSSDDETRLRLAEDVRKTQLILLKN